MRTATVGVAGRFPGRRAPMPLEVTSGAVLINNADVVKADIPATDGVIHVIDALIRPV